jgi:hypothetical protein
MNLIFPLTVNGNIKFMLPGFLNFHNKLRWLRANESTWHINRGLL